MMLDGPRSGATRRIECMAQALRQLGHEAILYRGKELGIPWRPAIARAAAERLHLPTRIEADRLDAIEWSHLPLSIPAMPGGPKILFTVHDLRHLSIAQHSPFSRRFFVRRVLLDAVNKAHRVIAVSEFTKTELLRHLPQLAPEKVLVIPNAADHLAPPDPPPARQDTILYVGHLEPRKNIGVLLEAFAILRKKGFPHRLQLAGAGKGEHENELRNKAAALGIADAIDWLGAVPEEKLPELYASAKVFAFPSLYEGFGIPLLEAMRCGTPVVAAKVGALPEVGAQACIFVAAHAPEEWAKALESLLIDTPRWSELSSQGKAHAQASKWIERARAILPAFLPSSAGLP